MNDYYTDPKMQEMMASAAVSACETDLSANEFEKTYFSSYGTYFWVVEDTETGVVYGSCAVKRITADSAEVVRMAVNPEMRGKGLGKLLIKELDNFCLVTGVLQVKLWTGNPGAAKFYGQCGFVNLAPEGSRVVRMVKYLGERVIRKVAIVGGTHGNERIGIELIRQWVADRTPVERSTFDTAVVMGNPLAVKKNIRYVESDMNRLFSEKDILHRTELLTTSSGVGEVKNTDIECMVQSGDEIQQAIDLNKQLGPKGIINGEYGCDYIIDLHSSNSNVGLMAMGADSDKDYHTLRLSEHLLSKNEFKDLKICFSKLNKNDSPNVDSISPYGIAYEVGPVAHGTLNYDMLEKTRQLVLSTLDFIEEQNVKLLQAASIESTYGESDIQLYEQKYEQKSFIESTKDKGVYSSQGRDVIYVKNVECEKIVCKKEPFNRLDCYVPVPPGIEYPDKTDKDIPLAERAPCMHAIHPMLEGKDWKIFEEGAPMFISTDGTHTVTPFVRPAAPTGGHGPPMVTTEPLPDLYPVFINEAAYQRGGIGFMLYKKDKRTIS
jgi:succinylglutamate desuccinylase